MLSIISTFLGHSLTLEDQNLPLRLLPLDSLTTIELLLYLEDRLGVPIADEEAELLGSASTLNDVIELIEEKLYEKLNHITSQCT